MSIYEDEGFKSRRDYLGNLAEEYDLPESIVFSFAGVLGSSEDFDGLLTMLEDASELNLN
jgi:hypothetical protein